MWMAAVAANISVVDNFLEPQDFVEIKSLLLGCNFPWFFNDGVVLSDKESDLTDFQFTHAFYKDYTICSPFFPSIDPIIKKIDPSAILRIKANLNTRMDAIYTREMHQDIRGFNGKTSVFYVNTNDGKTVFEDGTTIDSVANRLLTFDSTIKHAGTTCTNQKTRCVINLNYYPKYGN